MVDIKKVWIRKNQLRNSKHFFFLELLTVSKDRSIGIIDSATGKLEFQPEKAHEFVIFVISETFSRVQKSRITSLKIFFLFRASINLISQIDKNLFVTGDDIGVIKLWDFHEISKNSTNFASSDIKIDDDDQKPHKPSILRSMESKPVGILSEHEDYISDFEISKNGKELIAVGCVFWFFLKFWPICWTDYGSKSEEYDFCGLTNWSYINLNDFSLFLVFFEIFAILEQP